METTFTPGFNKPAWFGLAFILFPILFWIAVMQQIIFNYEGALATFVWKIDQASSFLSVMFCLILPLIALLINLFYLSSFKIFSEKKEWFAVVSFRPIPVNIAIVIFSAVNIAMITGYFFTENYMLIRR